MIRYLLIGTFGILGVFARYLVGALAHKFHLGPGTFPYATFAINIVGSCLIGVVYVLGVEKSFLSPDLRMGLMVGFLGGFTTFSSYCLESVRLVEEASYGLAALYLFGSPALGCLGAILGILLARKYA